MSIIGEMYEEEIWENNQKLKDKCEAFLALLDNLTGYSETDILRIQLAEEFRQRFANELKGNE